MKEITIISGKGGTGKTSFAGSFAAMASNAVFTDCDVDAANLRLIMRPVLQETHEFKASREAFIREESAASAASAVSSAALKQYGKISGLTLFPVKAVGFVITPALKVP